MLGFALYYMACKCFLLNMAYTVCGLSRHTSAIHVNKSAIPLPPNIFFQYTVYIHVAVDVQQTPCIFHSFSADNSNSRGAEPLYQNSKVAVYSSSSSDEADGIRRPPPYNEEWGQREAREPQPTAQKIVESQYETGYTTGDTGNELDRDHIDYLHRWVTTLLPVAR